ncbi:MAG: undecaprenyl/decaprenyl-phosphate alpha-N-acetylglucosaminyl 1-phosphate transferase [Bacteroidetes bacterium]|nr:MAG: undecaprenyl/decaprenyl-phosphate alpha-N-acetylglucosaminyl 1-phosphate transferase [Bacteroidota bacterium]
MFEKGLQLIGFAVAGIIVSLIINVLLLRFSKSLGIRNNNDVIVRWSNQSKPSLGGVSFFVVFLFSAIGFSIVFSDENIFHNFQYVGLLTAGSLAFLMGMADDAYNTKPLIKLLAQITCGLLFAYSGVVIEITSIFWVNAALTVIWVITIMNSLNMLDNMDGITGTTVVFILIACLLSSFIIFDFNRNIWSILMISQIGAIMGFLKYNINPSKLFMGDAGSQFIGLFVSFFSIKYLWNIGALTSNPPWVGMIICLITFTPAAADSLTVTINRLRKGQSPMVGGKDHTTHHLVYSGLSDRQVWYIFLMISFFSTLFGVYLVHLSEMGIVLPLIFFLLYFIVIFILLYRVTIKYRPPS